MGKTASLSKKGEGISTGTVLLRGGFLGYCEGAIT